MKKKADKIRKTLCLYFVQFQWGYTLPTLIPSTGRPDLTLLQCSKFSSCSHQRELYLNLLHSISLHLYLDKPHPSPLFTKKGYCIPRQSCSLDTQTPHFDATYKKKDIYKFFYYYNNYYYPLIKKIAIFHPVTQSGKCFSPLLPFQAQYHIR